MTEPLTLLDDGQACWNRIGIGGDRSCPELECQIHCRNCPVFASGARRFFERPAPGDYLEEWHALLDGDSSRDVSQEETVSLLIFRLGREWLALSTGVIAEVAPVRPVHRVPHRTNSIVLGLVNVRGQLHLGASLHGLLGVEATGDPHAGSARGRMLLLRQANEPWVVATDEVSGVYRIGRAELRGVPSTLANPAVSFSQAVFTWNGHSVGWLDEQRVFSGLRSLGR